MRLGAGTLKSVLKLLFGAAAELSYWNAHPKELQCCLLLSVARSGLSRGVSAQCLSRTMGRLHGDCLCSREQLGWCEDSLDYAPFIATELFDEALINKHDVYGFCFVKEDECPKESFPLNQWSSPPHSWHVRLHHLLTWRCLCCCLKATAQMPRCDQPGFRPPLS